MAVPTLGGSLRKDGHVGSNQLFALLEETESGGQQGEPATRVSLCSWPTSSGRRGVWSLWRPVVIVAGAMGLAACVAFAVLGMQRGVLEGFRQEPTENIPLPQQKDAAGVPPGLPQPPHPQLIARGHPPYHCSYTMSEKCPARELFWSFEVHEVATENLMQVGRGLFTHADRDLVRQTVAATFRNISAQLDERAPSVARDLAHVELGETQKNAVLTWLRLMSVPEVQQIGFEVALAIRRSMSADRLTVKRNVEQMLKSNLGEIRRLRKDLLSDNVLALWGSGFQWELTLDPENIEVMEASHDGKFFGSMNASFYTDSKQRSPKKLPHIEKAYGTWGGVLEEARALLDAIVLIARTSGTEIVVPAWATSLKSNVDVKDLGSELLSCELHDEDGMNNFMKAMFCPLKYGSQGMDALRAVDRLEATSAPTRDRTGSGTSALRGPAPSPLSFDV